MTEVTGVLQRWEGMIVERRGARSVGARVGGQIVFDLGDGVVRHDIGWSLSAGHSEPVGLRREKDSWQGGGPKWRVKD